MKFTALDVAFLTGRQFSNDYTINFESSSTGYDDDRTTLIKKLVAGSTVLHVGCVDHVPLIQQKRTDGTWLHDQLLESAAVCYGIDINESGIKHLGSLGIDRVYCCNIMNGELPSELTNVKFDFVVLGEMIEHVSNPLDFLVAIRNLLQSSSAVFITTTPNAFRIQNVFGALTGRERINTDHWFWFTPYTLAKSLANAGFRDIQIETAWNFRSESLRIRLQKQLIHRFFPAMKDCLIAISKF